MITKDKLCACGCGKSGKLWSKGMLKQCFFRLNPQPAIKKKNTPLKKSRLSNKITKKGLELKEKKKEYTQKQFAMFLEIWEERPHYCYESNQYLGNEALSTMFHHILPKGIDKYKKYALEKWNIVILDPSIHALVEQNIEKCPKVNQLTKELKLKYG